jgi:hypothetical protein
MKSKLFTYAALSVLGSGLLIGATTVSAQGFFGGTQATPDEIATRQQTMFDREARVLGISVAEVKQAWAEGKTMQQLMSEKGISEEVVQARLAESRLAQQKSHMQALVDKGVITQAQATTRLEYMSKQTGFSGKGMGMGQGKKGGLRNGNGMRGMGMGMGF